MKNKMIALLAGALMMLSAGSAFAYFGANSNDIYMAAYNASTSKELVIDIGTLSLSSDGTYYTLSNSTGSFNLSDLGANSTSAVKVAFYGADQYTTEFASSTVTSSPATAFGKQDSFLSSLNIINSTATTAGTTTQNYIGSTTNLNGYVSKMDASGAGSFAQMNDQLTGTGKSNFINPEISLATLAAGNLQGIFGFAYDSAKTPGVLAFTAGITDANGVESLTITNVNTAATPIPAAIYLMGSGLLGMFGLRRKQRG